MISMVLMLIVFLFLFKSSPEEAGFEPITEEDGNERDNELAEKIRQKGYTF